MPVAIAEGVILLFFVVFFISIGFTCLFTKRGIIRKIAVTCVVVLFFGPFLLLMASNVLEYLLEQIKTLPARKIFYDRCATAGEKVYKTVDNVEGILLLNVRGMNNNGYEGYDLHWPDAALPREASRDSYIHGFLKKVYGDDDKSKGSKYKYYFDYVDVKEEHEIMRYRIDTENNGKLKKEPSPPELARYAVYFTNHDNMEDRKIGIAGTTITIADSFTGEKMAESTSYAFIRFRLGSAKSKNWYNAIKCPKNKSETYVTRNFVNQVIKPKQEY